MSLAVVDLGCANLASVGFALDRLGARYRVTSDKAAIEDAERVILPGVGSASYAAGRLDALGLRETLQGFTRPLFGVCLGMQLLFEASEEGDAQCLALLPGRVRRLAPPAGEPWPHMGWSRLSITVKDSRLFAGVEDGAYAYFVHGFAAPISEATAATAIYDAPFTAAVEEGNLFGCQFHPERSGEAGARILKNFLDIPC